MLHSEMRKAATITGQLLIYNVAATTVGWTYTAYTVNSKSSSKEDTPYVAMAFLLIDTTTIVLWMVKLICIFAGTLIAVAWVDSRRKNPLSYFQQCLNYFCVYGIVHFLASLVLSFQTSNQALQRSTDSESEFPLLYNVTFCAVALFIAMRTLTLKNGNQGAGRLKEEGSTNTQQVGATKEPVVSLCKKDLN